MALSNLTFQAGAPQNLVSAGLDALKYRVNPYEALAKGYDDQQKRNLQLQAYREAKIKADLATALYPQQSQLQQAMLQARIDALKNPQTYGVNPSLINPISTAPVKTAVTDKDGNTTVKDTSTPGLPAYKYNTYGNEGFKLQTPGSQFPGNPNTDLPPLPFVPYQTGNPLSDSTENSINPFGEAIPDVPV